MIQAFETKAPEKAFPHLLLGHKTNDWVRSKIRFLEGPQEILLATVKRRKLEWFRYVIRHNILFKTIFQSTFKAWRLCGWQRKCWMDKVKEWTSLPMPDLLTMVSRRTD